MVQFADSGASGPATLPEWLQWQARRQGEGAKAQGHAHR